MTISDRRQAYRANPLTRQGLASGSLLVGGRVGKVPELILSQRSLLLHVLCDRAYFYQHLPFGRNDVCELLLVSA